MGDISSEPSMEEILSSIKKIIAEDSVKAVSARIRPGSRAVSTANDSAVPKADVVPIVDLAKGAGELAAPAVTADIDDDSIFELTEAAAADDAELVSDEAIRDSRSALSSLSKPNSKPQSESGNALEDMVREMLRPMLKDWLNANLADIVRSAVAREVARISARDN